MAIDRTPRRVPYEIHGLYGDGWMAPWGDINVLDPEPGKLKLRLEIPGFLPFKFPLSIKSVQDDREIKVLQASKPGRRTLRIPVREPGIIKLSADQWFVPKKLGLSHDTRQICYRVCDVTWERKKKSGFLSRLLGKAKKGRHEPATTLPIDK
jgi:hypothetical protein